MLGQTDALTVLGGRAEPQERAFVEQPRERR
jgi:hypothetical protein